MEIYPAIDIRDGKVVRLTKGDYDKMTVYADHPEQIAEEFIRAGAKNLHTVDLDGAKEGTLCNFDIIEGLTQSGRMFVEVGGGIRDEKRIAAYLEAGAGRVILGSVAVENPGFVGDMVKKYGDAVAVGVDAVDQKVAIHGWKTVSDLDSLDFCRKMHETMGVSTVIYTDISRDGTLSGTNLKVYEKLSEIKGLQIIASGGITFEEEIGKLKEMGVYGAILGKALYTGKLSLSRAIEIASEKAG